MSQIDLEGIKHKQTVAMVNVSKSELNLQDLTKAIWESHQPILGYGNWITFENKDASKMR